MVEVNWTNLALDDIENIAQFIANDSLRFAKIQAARFFQSAEILSSLPKAGRIVPEINNEEIRELILGNYRIIYQIVSKKRIDIITVHHSKRLISNNPLFG